MPGRSAIDLAWPTTNYLQSGRISEGVADREYNRKYSNHFTAPTVSRRHDALACLIGLDGRHTALSHCRLHLSPPCGARQLMATRTNPGSRVAVGTTTVTGLRYLSVTIFRLCS